jgi:phage terminase small subunit
VTLNNLLDNPNKMAKKNRIKTLKEIITEDMQERGVYSSIDEHLIDLYVSQKEIIDDLVEQVKEGEVVEDAAGRNSETVANPAMVRLPSMISALNQLGKSLSIGPYSRKLTTGIEKQKQQVQTKASMLRPLERRKTN